MAGSLWVFGVFGLAMGLLCQRHVAAVAVAVVIVVDDFIIIFPMHFLLGNI